MTGCNHWQKPPVRNQKIIIFDSPDGTGKTEISYAVSQALKIPYFRMDTQHENWRKGKFKEALEFDQTYLASFLRQTKTDVVIDRAYPAEWVYSQVFGRETNMDVLQKVDVAFAQMGAYIVIPLRRSYEGSRKDDLVAPGLLPVLHEKYLEFRKWTRCNTVTMFVDDFGNAIPKQVPLLLGEFEWGERLGFKTDVTLERPREKTDIQDILKSEPESFRTLEFGHKK